MLCTVMDRGRSDLECFVVEVGAACALGFGLGAVLGRPVSPHAPAWAWQKWPRVREVESAVDCCTGPSGRWRYAVRQMCRD